MLILTKYKQAIIKVFSAFVNSLFFIWLKKIFSNKKIFLFCVAIFCIILLLWQFHFKEVLSDVNPPYKHASYPRKDAFPLSPPTAFDSTTLLESPIASEVINIDRLGYKLTKLYYQNGVDYFRCATTNTEKNDLQYYCDASINTDNSLRNQHSDCTRSPLFCTEEQVFTFQNKKQESFYRRSPGEKIIRLVKEYKSGNTILTDYRINYLPPYNQFTGLSTSNDTGELLVATAGNPEIKTGIGSADSGFVNYNGKASNLQACKAGAGLQDIGNTCMLKIKIDNAYRVKINSGDLGFASANDYCHNKTREDPVLGDNCRLPSCLSISKEYYRRPGINCLADCNDRADFNGIDDVNLKLPGINCLPACETGSKTVLYGVDSRDPDKLLPKDIGVTCFLKHQGYVMPVCNNTPLANFSSNSNSQETANVKNIANPHIPRKDCMNAADLPLCAFFNASTIQVAEKFGCLGMVKQNVAGGSPVFVDNEYILGVAEINKTDKPTYDEDLSGSAVNLKSIPIINYEPRNCNDTSSSTIGCGKPYTYSKLAQAALSIPASNYLQNVDMIQVQDALFNDTLNHDSVNEAHADSLKVKPFRNTTRNDGSGAFFVGSPAVKYKITQTLDNYYNATNKPSCSLLTKQELKFIGTRNCDLNQIWKDSTGGKNGIADTKSSTLGKNFCEGEYFCKVDTRCSMFSDEQLQEAKAFFHCLPAQYSKYEDANIKCNILNDLEILALTKTTKQVTSQATSIELDELKNYITKACFKGNLAFLIHKRIDHNIIGPTVPAVPAGFNNYDNIPDYSNINHSVFDATVFATSPSGIDEECNYYANTIDYMFPTNSYSYTDSSGNSHTISVGGSSLSGKFACYHSSQFSCRLDHYKKACYLLSNYKFKNFDIFFNGQKTITSISDTNINDRSIGCLGTGSNPKKCVVNYALNSLGSLDCFNDYANFTNTDVSGAFDANKGAIINKCDADPLLLTIFVPSAKTTINYSKTSLSYKIINSNNTSCYDCYCFSINDSDKARYVMSGGLAIDFDSSVKSICQPANSCYICYKPNFYAGLFKKSTPPDAYYPIIENEVVPPSGIPPEGSLQEVTSDMGYYQYEDPFYSWFFFPKPNTSGLDATQTVRDCGSNQKCYKAFTVDFPNSRGTSDSTKSGYLNRVIKSSVIGIRYDDKSSIGKYLDFFQYPPIYYYGHGNYGDDSEKEKYNLVSSKEGLDSGILDRVGLHSINKIASPSAVALRGSTVMGINPYGDYTYTSSFDRKLLCGMNRDTTRLPDESTFAYFAPVLVQGGRFGLKTNNVMSDTRRFAFSDTKWNSATKKLEYYVNICLRYESTNALGACGRRECRIDNPPGMMQCGEDQCRKFMVEDPGTSIAYSKCHLLSTLADIDGKKQSVWFVNDLLKSLPQSDPLKIGKFLDEYHEYPYRRLPDDYEKCAKLYSNPDLERLEKLGKSLIPGGAIWATWDYTNHRVRAFYDQQGYVCAELDFYGIDLNTYNLHKEDMNKASYFELPNGAKICYGGRVFDNNKKDCSFAEGSFNTFADLNTRIGGMPGLPDHTVWRTVRKIKFISNISDDPNIEFLGYSVPSIAENSTRYDYRRDTNVGNLFPAKMKAKDGLITMVYDHDTRIRTIKRIDPTLDEDEIFKSHQKDDRDKAAEERPDNKYGLLQMSRGKKNPYYGFNGYRNDNDPTWLWLSTSFPDDLSSCVLFLPVRMDKSDNCSLDWFPFGTDITTRREDGSVSSSSTNPIIPISIGALVAQPPRPSITEALYNKDFQPNNFLKEKVWLKSDCVPVQKRVGFPLISAVSTPDNAPNLFAPEPMVFALKTTSSTNPWKKATEISDIDKLNFSDPEIVLRYGDKYYYLQIPKKHASLTKCNNIEDPPTIIEGKTIYKFDDTGNERLKFMLKEIPGITNENDLIDQLNSSNGQSDTYGVNKSKNTVSTTATSRFEDDSSFKEHHNPNLNTIFGADTISNKCSSNTKPYLKPYGVVIASNLKQINASTSNTTLYAQIFVKKEQQGENPVLCVYRASMNGNLPATVEDGDLKVIACFARQQPLVNNMKLFKTDVSADDSNAFLNHEVRFQYKYSDVSSHTDIADMFKIFTSSGQTVATKYQLKDTADGLNDAKNLGFIEDHIYFEGIQISSARHYCTTLNLDCVDNEREIQKICNNEELICNRSIVQTEDDFNKLNSSINNSNYNDFKAEGKSNIQQNLYRMLKVRNFCINTILNSCNETNGYTHGDIENYPEIKTLHPEFNNRIRLESDISDSAKDALGFNNMICLKKGVENLIVQPPQFVEQKEVTGLSYKLKGKMIGTDNYKSCPTSASCRFAEVYEYKIGVVASDDNIISGINNLCVGIGGGAINAPKLVRFCKAKLYPLQNLKYGNFVEDYLDRNSLIQQGNIKYKSLISKAPSTYSVKTDTQDYGVDISHQDREDGQIIRGNSLTANAELDVAFVDDQGIYGVCNGFWKNKNIDNSPRYKCTASDLASTPSLTLPATPPSSACERYSCPTIEYGKSSSSDVYENQADRNGLYSNDSAYSIGLDVIKRRGWAYWKTFVKTTDFIEDVHNKSACLVGFAKDGATLNASLFDDSVCARPQIADSIKMLTAICPNQEGSVNNVYHNTGGPLPATQCNQFGYWRFEWGSQEFLKDYNGGIFSGNRGETVLNSCQRIKCSITDLENKFLDSTPITPIKSTPIRLIKQKCGSTSAGNQVIIAELNTQITSLYLEPIDNKYYYLKTNNLAPCKDATELHIIKIGDTAVYNIDISAIASDSDKRRFNGNDPVNAWYFKITKQSLNFIINDADLLITTKRNKSTIEHEKLLKVWSKIAGFQPDTKDTRTLIPAMRNKTIEHAQISGKKTSDGTPQQDDDDYDIEGKCLVSLGYRIIAANFDPELLCNYQGILKIKEPCISTCDAVDVSMADTEIHGYSQWAETENKIKICGDRCSPVTTKIPFSYISKSTPSCFTGKKPYPYPPFRSLEGVKFEFISNPIVSYSVSYDDISSTKSTDVYDADKCTSLDGCIVEFDKANIAENVFLKKSGTTYPLYKKDSLGAKEKFASYDILPNVKYQIKLESGYYLLVLVQPAKMTDDNRWQEYNINKRKIFTTTDCSGGNSVNCLCGHSTYPACPFDNVLDKISEGEVVEINLSSDVDPSVLKFSKNPYSTNDINISGASLGNHFVLQLVKNSAGHLQWQQINNSGVYNGLERVLLLPGGVINATINNCMQSNDISGSPSIDYNCTMILPPGSPVLTKNQETEITFSSPSPSPTSGNPSDNYMINYNAKPVKKYNSQGNLITDFNHQELSGKYILRAIDEATNGVGIDYYLLINATDFLSKTASNPQDNYPLPSRTCRYGIGNVWSLPDSACQNTCPGLTQAVATDGDVEAIITDNNFDSRIGSAITEHKIDATRLNLTANSYLNIENSSSSAVLNRDKIAVKVVNITGNQATLHIIWPELPHKHDVTLILKKSGNTYRIIQDKLVLNNPPVETDPFSALHYEKDGMKDSVILYRRCGESGKWQDPISLCPIAGPAKGGYDINSILGFVRANNIEPGSDHSPTIESIRGSTSFDFSIGFDQGLLKQSTLYDMTEISDAFYRLAEETSAPRDSIRKIPVIPDYRIIGDSNNRFGVSNNKFDVSSLDITSKNIYAYAMCNYNYVDSTPPAPADWKYYNFYNPDFGNNPSAYWGTNLRYRCENSSNYLNTYKISPENPSSRCVQKCNSGIIQRIGRQGSSGANIDKRFDGSGSIENYSKVTISKAYFVSDDPYEKYKKFELHDNYNFYNGVYADQSKQIKKFAIFGAINNMSYQSNVAGLFNLFEKRAIGNDDDADSVSAQSQCNNEIGTSTTVTSNVTYGYITDGKPSSVFCWGLKRTGNAPMNPSATCRERGEWGLTNSFIGQKQEQSQIFRYTSTRTRGSQVDEHSVANGVIYEMFFQYGDLRIEKEWIEKGVDDGCVMGKGSMCDSLVSLFKDGRYNYDNRRLPDFADRDMIVDRRAANVCNCSGDWFGSGKFGERIYAEGIQLLDPDFVLPGAEYFQRLCNSYNSHKGLPPSSCRGFYSNKTVDGVHILAEDCERAGDCELESGECHYYATCFHSGDFAAGVDKNLKIIMWGCPDNYDNYDYNSRTCKKTGVATIIRSGYAPAPTGRICSSSPYTLPTQMMLVGSSNTQVTLYEGMKTEVECKNNYDTASGVLSCDGSGSTPQYVNTLTCRPKNCGNRLVPNFCSREKISGCPVSLDHNNYYTGTCEGDRRTANEIICDSGNVRYRNDPSNPFSPDKLCGIACTYSSSADGFNIVVASEKMRHQDVFYQLQCRSGYTIHSNDSSSDLSVTCDQASGIIYTNNRCISINYCILPVDNLNYNIATTNCNQPGIFCKKDDGSNIISIFISQDDSNIVNVNCPTGSTGSKLYRCTTQSSFGSPPSLYDNLCSTNTCAAPSATVGYTLPSRFTYSYTGSTPLSISGASCDTGYSGTPAYECLANSVGSSTQATLRGCNLNTCKVPATAGYKSLPEYVDYNTTPQPITGASCDTGYSGTPTYICSANSVGSTTARQLELGGCAINICTAPSIIPAGYVLPSAFTYSYTGSAISRAISGVSCATGYRGSVATATYTCNKTNSDPTSATIQSFSGCTINTCTAPTAPSGYTFPAVSSFTYSYTGSTPERISGASCAAGYSGTAIANYTCNNISTDNSQIPAVVSSSNIGGCARNACTAPSVIPTGYVLPSVFTYSHTGSTPEQITGVSCAAGYSGNAAATYTCNNTSGSSTTATISSSRGCAANSCTAVLKNYDNTLNIRSANVSTGSVNFNNIFDNLLCNSYYQTKVKVDTYPPYSFVCNPAGTVYKLGNCYDKCAVGSGVIMTNTAYKNRNSSTIYLDHNSTSNNDIICNTGYSGTASYVCNNGTLSGLQGCAINTCTAPSTDGYVLPSVFTYSYTWSTPLQILGASCDTGYSGTPTYECSASIVGSLTQATLSGCNIKCGTLANSDYSSREGVHGNTATCNGGSGYGSSNPGSNPICQANGTWSAYCRWNSCNVNQIPGYVRLPATVPNLNSTGYVYHFSPTNVPCDTGYTGVYLNSGVYNCWNTNSDGTNINIDPRGCIKTRIFLFGEGAFFAENATRDFKIIWAHFEYGGFNEGQTSGSCGDSGCQNRFSCRTEKWANNNNDIGNDTGIKNTGGIISGYIDNNTFGDPDLWCYKTARITIKECPIGTKFDGALCVLCNGSRADGTSPGLNSCQ